MQVIAGKGDSAVPVAVLFLAFGAVLSSAKLLEVSHGKINSDSDPINEARTRDPTDECSRETHQNDNRKVKRREDHHQHHTIGFDLRDTQVSKVTKPADSTDETTDNCQLGTFVHVVTQRRR